MKVKKTVYPFNQPPFNEWMVYIYTELKKSKYKKWKQITKKDEYNESTNEKINDID